MFGVGFNDSCQNIFENATSSVVNPARILSLVSSFIILNVSAVAIIPKIVLSVCRKYKGFMKIFNLVKNTIIVKDRKYTNGFFVG